MFDEHNICLGEVNTVNGTFHANNNTFGRTFRFAHTARLLP